MIETRRTTFTRLELAGSGIVDRSDVRAAAEALEAALDGDGRDEARAVLLLDLRAVEDVTMKAFSADVAATGRLLPKLARLDRVAVVGDASWLDALARGQGSAAPRLRVRAFDADGIDAARRWLGADDAAPGGGTPSDGGASDDGASDDGPSDDGSGPPPAEPFSGRSIEELVDAAFEALTGRGRDERPVRPVRPVRPARRDRAGRRDVPTDDAAPGLRMDEGDEPGFLVLDLDGRVGRADVEAAAARLDAPAGPKVRLLARLRRFEGVEPAALLSPALWRLQREGLSRVSRAAVVTSVEWLGRAIESAARLQGVEVRTFAPDDEAGARAWLESAATA